MRGAISGLRALAIIATLCTSMCYPLAVFPRP